MFPLFSYFIFLLRSARIKALARAAGAELSLDVSGRDPSEVEESAHLSRARSGFFSVERRCGRADYLNHNNSHTSDTNTPAKITTMIPKKKRALLIIFYIISFVGKTAVPLILSHSSALHSSHTVCRGSPCNSIFITSKLNIQLGVWPDWNVKARVNHCINKYFTCGNYVKIFQYDGTYEKMG